MPGLIVFGKFVLMDINLTVGLEIVKLNSMSMFPAICYILQIEMLLFLLLGGTTTRCLQTRLYHVHTIFK